MSQIYVRCERVIEARPEEVFRVLADYVEKRPRVLPPQFQDYHVVDGGTGTGTTVCYRLHAGGRVRAYTMYVEETTPGQVLTERDKGSSLVTRWTVRPIAEGQRSRVQVETSWSARRGVGGIFE